MRDLHIRLSDEEHAIIAAYAREHRVSIAAVVAALARWLDSEVDPVRVKGIVREARQIDDERGRRK